jgi:hypothetical protein
MGISTGMIKLKDILFENINQPFKEWFDGSKIVDSSGNPMILYHGTNKPISSFSSHRMGNSSNVFGSWQIKRYGIFLAEDEKLALEYGSHLIKCYGACFNPLDLRKEISDSLFNTLEHHVEQKYGNGFHFARFILRHAGGSHTWALFDEDEGYEPEFMIKVFKEIGYDGVIIEESSENVNNTKTWVLFDPDQVWII